MPMVVNGLPAHVLMVHLVVVLVPAAAVLLILAIVWPAARERIGIFGPLIAAITLVLVPLTAEAGEWFKDRLDIHDETIEHHADLGSTMVYWSIGVFVLAVAWWIIASNSGRKLLAKMGPLETFAANKVVRILVGILAVVVAVGSVYTVIMIGDTGAQATWSGYKDLLSK